MVSLPLFSLDVDHEVELLRPLYWQVTWLGPLQDLVELEVLAAVQDPARLTKSPRHQMKTPLAARSIVRVIVRQAWTWPSSNL